jgi:methylated-DNA-[protein]-cysteine S-methyltransferase
VSWTTHGTPLGSLRLEASPAGLSRVTFGAPATAGNPEPTHPVLAAAAGQIDEYLAGRRPGFDVPLAPAGTPFQRAVWDAVAAIPFGATASYLDIAHTIGRPDRVRPVGAAIGANPLLLVVPCHRVVGSDGALVGYAGGLHRKRRVLELEAGARQGGTAVTAALPAAGLAHRVDALDWEAIGRDLDTDGHALLPALLAPEECRELAAGYDRPERFRARVDMARHRFGEGEYQYFADPLPEPVAELRGGLLPAPGADSDGVGGPPRPRAGSRRLPG